MNPDTMNGNGIKYHFYNLFIRIIWNRYSSSTCLLFFFVFKNDFFFTWMTITLFWAHIFQSQNAVSNFVEKTLHLNFYKTWLICFRRKMNMTYNKTQTWYFPGTKNKNSVNSKPCQMPTVLNNITIYESETTRKMMDIAIAFW